MVSASESCKTGFVNVLSSLVNSKQLDETECDGLKKKYKDFVDL
jgi:hypothetical protein